MQTRRGGVASGIGDARACYIKYALKQAVLAFNVHGGARTLG